MLSQVSLKVKEGCRIDSNVTTEKKHREMSNFGIEPRRRETKQFWNPLKLETTRIQSLYLGEGNIDLSSL